MTQPKKKPAARRAPAKKKAPAKKAGTRGARATTKAARAGSMKKRGEEAAKRAKDAGATGKRLTAAKTQLRDSMIVARKAQGMGIEAIAAEAGVTTRTVERVLADRRGVQSPLDQPSMALLEDLAVGLKLSIGDYEAMALAWFDVNQSASLGAKKAADETRARLATLMADVGKLPSNLELFRTEAALRQIAERMVEVMHAVADGKMSAEDAAREFGELIVGHERRQLAAGEA